MCMMLYIASDKELPLIEWKDKSKIPICVTTLHKSDSVVTKQFSKSNVYYVGSFEGCGCGFQYDNKTLDLDGFPEKIANEIIDDHNKRKNSVKGLFEYLKQNIKGNGEIELYSCWAGNESGEPELITRISLSTFSFGSSFKFEENQLIKIVE